MNINEIYQQFSIPQNLQEHMFRVFGVVSVIENNWTGEKLDWGILKKLTLLHDLGNIVKFNLKEDEMYLKETQKAIIKKYGSDDHIATGKMVSELGFDSEAVKIIQSKSFGNSVEITNSNNYLLKILYYADMRVLPTGVGTLEDRLSDIRNRMPKYTTRPDFEDLINACREVEKQLQEKVSIPLVNINDDLVNIHLSKALKFELELCPKKLNANF